MNDCEQNRKYRGVWKSFITMLYESKLPYTWMIGALVLNLLKSTVDLITPQRVAKILTNELSVELLIGIFWLGMLSVVLRLVSSALNSISLQKIEVKENIKYESTNS